MSDKLTEQIIGRAIEVHRILGPRLLESIYEEALCHELLYLKSTRFKRALLINFGEAKLVDGIKRFSGFGAKIVTDNRTSSCKPSLFKKLITEIIEHTKNQENLLKNYTHR